MRNAINPTHISFIKRDIVVPQDTGVFLLERPLHVMFFLTVNVIANGYRPLIR